MCERRQDTVIPHRRRHGTATSGKVGEVSCPCAGGGKVLQLCLDSDKVLKIHVGINAVCFCIAQVRCYILTWTVMVRCCDLVRALLRQYNLTMATERMFTQCATTTHGRRWQLLQSHTDTGKVLQPHVCGGRCYALI